MNLLATLSTALMALTCAVLVVVGDPGVAHAAVPQPQVPFVPY